MADMKARFQRSSIARARSAGDEAADLLHAGSSGLRPNWFQARAALRFLNGPAANDILEWASFSSRNTQRLSALLLGQLPPRAGAFVLRDLASVVAPERKTGTQ